MNGWMRFYGGRKLHYLERTAYYGRSTAICEATGVARDLDADYDNFLSREYGRWPRCEKCKKKLAEEK